jgi:hypothetical protein
MENNSDRSSREESLKIKDFHVRIPWGLAERVRIYAVEHRTTLNNVVIEALDTFLRQQQK